MPHPLPLSKLKLYPFLMGCLIFDFATPIHTKIGWNFGELWNGNEGCLITLYTKSGDRSGLNIVLALSCWAPHTEMFEIFSQHTNTFDHRYCLWRWLCFWPNSLLVPQNNFGEIISGKRTDCIIISHTGSQTYLDKPSWFHLQDN